MFCRIVEIVCLILSIFTVVFGVLCVLSPFFVSGLTFAEILVAILFSMFIILIGIGGAWASISYMRI